MHVGLSEEIDGERCNGHPERREEQVRRGTLEARLHESLPDSGSGGRTGPDSISCAVSSFGAQVAHAFRRFIHRAKRNADGVLPLAIGMSATLGDPAMAWGRLIGSDAVTEIRPSFNESDTNPRGREYYFFVQPEIESRGNDIAGASTTIQAVMCLAHGMSRRTG